ncbi:flagellar FliL protein [Scopulibacillus darangshiensis]|uniref:Flagellar protein FliL n=1 Tax=Scopulibacillus darangshiensis TaxID=442528 RepID=A0A4R2P662_9BACL|nr:flagellar basal body-associated protein FliL [Scopulibacillus darangshiensis]TCP30322.1 flagellar FliL protein [Scopulibacillus darangshiensis]
MFKSKGLNIVFIIMAVVIFLGISSFLVMNYIKGNHTSAANDEVTIDDIVENLTVDTEEITTNLRDDDYIKVTFKIQVSNKEAKEELGKREFQVKNAIIYTLSGLTPKVLLGPKGLANLEAMLKEKLNAFLERGQVTHVYTTEKIIQ